MVGENGAGKSTLIKILGGAHRANAGELFMQGKRASIDSPSLAQTMGVSIIYQEFNLIPDLNVRENIYLGRERKKVWFLDEKREAVGVRILFERLGLKLDPETLCRDLTIAEQQLVEIAKALSLDAKILVMDEPSATLTQQEVDRLFAMIRDLKEEGIGIIYISHRLEEVFEIADRVMVLRDGRQVVTKPVSKVNRPRLIEWMVGRSLESEFPPRQSKPGIEWPEGGKFVPWGNGQRCEFFPSGRGDSGFCRIGGRRQDGNRSFDLRGRQERWRDRISGRGRT